MTVFILRGAYANEYELQNYYPLAKKLDIRVITTGRTLTPISLPTIKLWSPSDLPNFPYKKQILNRLIGGDQWLVSLAALIKNFDYSNNRSIIHTAETYTPYTHQAVQLRKKGLIDKLVCTCWETIPHNNEKFSVLRRWKKEAYQVVDIFHTPTVRAKDALVKEGVNPKKIIVIPYSVDLKNFPNRDLPADKAGRKIHKHPVILTVARLVEEKGIVDIEKVASQLPQYDFLVVGKGSYKFKAKNIHVRSVPYDEMPSIYKQADLFFFPSLVTPTWEEQYGMALIEAMAIGLPIVATNTGAIPEVAGQAAILIKDQEIKHFVKAIKHILTSNTLYKQLSAKSIIQARKLSKLSLKLGELFNS